MAAATESRTRAPPAARIEPDLVLLAASSARRPDRLRVDASNDETAFDQIAATLRLGALSHRSLPLFPGLLSYFCSLQSQGLQCPLQSQGVRRGLQAQGVHTGLQSQGVHTDL